MSKEQPKGQPLKLNLDATPYQPKSKMSTPLQPPSALSSSNTRLSIKAKPFIPKYKQKINATQTAPKPEAPKPKKIDREYFVIDEDDKTQYDFDYEYMISFENWEICQETKLLTEEYLKHLEDFKIVEYEQIKQNNMKNKGRKNYYGDKKNKEEKKKENPSSWAAPW